MEYKIEMKWVCRSTGFRGNIRNTVNILVAHNFKLLYCRCVDSSQHSKPNKLVLDHIDSGLLLIGPSTFNNFGFWQLLPCDKTSILACSHYQQVWTNWLDYGRIILWMVLVEKLLAILDILQISYCWIQRLDLYSHLTSAHNWHLLIDVLGELQVKQNFTWELDLIDENGSQNIALNFADILLSILYLPSRARDRFNCTLNFLALYVPHS